MWNAFKRWSTATIGVFFLVLTAVVASSRTFVVDSSLVLAPPLALAAAITIVGVILARQHDGEFVAVVTGIVLLAAAVGLVSFWWVGFLRLERLMLLTPPEALLTVLLLLASFGLVVGYFYSNHRRNAVYLERSNARLRDQNQRLEEFIGFVSHDLRNPLAIASGHLTLARRTGDEKHFDAIEQALARMETLVESVVDFSDDSRLELPTERVHIGTVVGEAVESCPIDRSNVVVDADEEIDAVPERLQALFENFLANAALHADPDSIVEIGLLDGGRGFYVQDDGPGVPPKDRERVFEAGYTTADDVEPSRGLGLSVVRQIGELHGWTVDVPESPSGGARFEVRTT